MRQILPSGIYGLLPQHLLRWERGNPVNPDTARRCQYCKQPLIPLLRKRFKPIKVLGQGGFGRTYLAEDQDKLNRRCVLKQLMPQGGSKAVELF
jgi:serine/threonine protein kinase